MRLSVTCCLAVIGLVVSVTSASDAPSFLFLLGDDIGWADFFDDTNSSTAYTPHLDALAKAKGTILLKDLHSQVVCSPTRATVLTGRDPFRDCVDFVYGCSDVTECAPAFEFAPNKTFTAPMAVGLARQNYESFFQGKWHLGSLDFHSEARGGITSNPQTHGFTQFNATVEVAPTATTNCNCNPDWEGACEYGHYGKGTHCNGGPGPGSTPGHNDNCCFNYWEADPSNDQYGLRNYTQPTPEDDTVFLTDGLERFLESRNGEPFMSQVSFHNNHIPYIATDYWRQQCASGISCKPGNYSAAQLDYYGALNALDAAVGRILEMLEKFGYRENTMIWLATDNGPEGDCAPEGRCSAEHFQEWPGTAGILRGRKRDIWEGGHRVPGLISWPAMIPDNRVSWDMVATEDFLPTVMEITGVKRPADQQDWALDGRSIMPLVKGGSLSKDFGRGWMFKSADQRGYRYGDLKLVENSDSCRSADCRVAQLFNLTSDLAEAIDISKEQPEDFAMMKAKMDAYFDSINESRVKESGCSNGPLAPPSNTTDAE